MNKEEPLLGDDKVCDNGHPTLMSAEEVRDLYEADRAKNRKEMEGLRHQAERLRNAVDTAHRVMLYRGWHTLARPSLEADAWDIVDQIHRDMGIIDKKKDTPSIGDQKEGSDKNLPDHLAVVENKTTGLFHGAYYRNIPTPSGCDRFWLHTTTTQGFESPHDAAKAIAKAYPDMPYPGVD